MISITFKSNTSVHQLAYGFSNYSKYTVTITKCFLFIKDYNNIFRIKTSACSELNSFTGSQEVIRIYYSQ